MGKSSRIQNIPMAYLRAWRESLGMSRQVVADRLASLTGKRVDQATVAKWEENGVRVEDLVLLAEVYGVTADRIFFPPGDKWTPAAMMAAHHIIISAEPEKVLRWLASGSDLAPPGPPLPTLEPDEKSVI